MEMSPCPHIGVVLCMYHWEGKNYNKQTNKQTKQRKTKRSFKVYPLDTSQTRETSIKVLFLIKLSCTSLWHIVVKRLFTATDYKSTSFLERVQLNACKHGGMVETNKTLLDCYKVWPCKESWVTFSSFLRNIWRSKLVSNS